jgi:hypothetical protein
MKKRIINSIGGIGDILFSEPIFRHYWQKDGVKPIVVIHNHMMWIKDYIDSANFTSECPKEFETGSLFHNEHYINLRYANQIYRGYEPHDHHDFENMMLDKYRLLRLSEGLWKTIDIRLDFKNTKGFSVNKSLFLQQTHLAIHPCRFNRYVLVNNHSQIGSVDIKTHKNPIYMSKINGYNLIDWWHTIMCAGENHHVSTSTFFLMQAIKNKFPDWNVPCYIYPRPNEDGLRGISQLKPDFNLIRVEK